MSMCKEIRFCRDHNIYYLPYHQRRHEKCRETWKLEWDEVVFYLNKYKTLKDLIGQLRIELGW